MQSERINEKICDCNDGEMKSSHLQHFIEQSQAYATPLQSLINVEVQEAHGARLYNAAVFLVEVQVLQTIFYVTVDSY